MRLKTLSLSGKPVKHELGTEGVKEQGQLGKLRLHSFEAECKSWCGSSSVEDHVDFRQFKIRVQGDHSAKGGCQGE